MLTGEPPVVRKRPHRRPPPTAPLADKRPARKPPTPAAGYAGQGMELQKHHTKTAAISNYLGALMGGSRKSYAASFALKPGQRMKLASKGEFSRVVAAWKIRYATIHRRNCVAFLQPEKNGAIEYSVKLKNGDTVDFPYLSRGKLVQVGRAWKILRGSGGR